jgi:hypothetical protein
LPALKAEAENARAKGRRTPRQPEAKIVTFDRDFARRAKRAGAIGVSLTAP